MKHKIPLVIGVVGILVLSALTALPIQAIWLRVDHDNADTTAYVMGTNGAGGLHAIRPGDAAVHYTCNPNCAPVIPFGTYLYFKNGFSVSIPNGSRNPPTPDTFTSLVVNDDGAGFPDPYWFDVYFGRWKFASAPCSCNGVNGITCTNGYTSSCANANGYGHHSVSYYFYRWVN